MKPLYEMDNIDLRVSLAELCGITIKMTVKEYVVAGYGRRAVDPSIVVALDSVGIPNWPEDEKESLKLCMAVAKQRGFVGIETTHYWDDSGIYVRFKYQDSTEVYGSTPAQAYARLALKGLMDDHTR